MINCLNRRRSGNSFRNGYVALIPKTNDLIDKVATMLQTEYGY